MLQKLKTLVNTILIILLLVWVVFVLTPSVKMSNETKAVIDSLNVHIKTLEENNKKIDTAISLYNKEVDKIDNTISNIKNEKTIIKEIYHEKIINVDNYSAGQIDSFFTNRYGLHP
jgi:hypothetical protein